MRHFPSLRQGKWESLTGAEKATFCTNLRSLLELEESLQRSDAGRSITQLPPNFRGVERRYLLRAELLPPAPGRQPLVEYIPASFSKDKKITLLDYLILGVKHQVQPLFVHMDSAQGLKLLPKPVKHDAALLLDDGQQREESLALDLGNEWDHRLCGDQLYQQVTGAGEVAKVQLMGLLRPRGGKSLHSSYRGRPGEEVPPGGSCSRLRQRVDPSAGGRG